MDLKFIIIIGCLILMGVLIMNEISTLKRDVQTKIDRVGEIIGKYTNELKNEYKEETNQSIIRFKTMTNEMISQFRIMNNLEKQSIVAISDHFDIATDENKEKEKIAGKNIPYLSEMNGTIELKKKSSSKESLYMSNTDKENNVFIIRDESGTILPSVKKNAHLSDIKETDKLKRQCNPSVEEERPIEDENDDSNDENENNRLKIKQHMEILQQSHEDGKSVNKQSLDSLSFGRRSEDGRSKDGMVRTTKAMDTKNNESMISDKSSKHNNDHETYEQIRDVRDKKITRIEKLSNITNYNKPDLVNLAKQYNIRTTILVGTKEKELTKKELYDILSKTLRC